MGAEWRGRSIVAAVKDAEDTFRFGRTAGEESVTLTDAKQIPNHTHTASISSGHKILQNKDFPTDTSRPNVFGTDKFMEVSGKAISVTIDSSGGGKMAHNNMPPFVALYMCRKN